MQHTRVAECARDGGYVYSGEQSVFENVTLEGLSIVIPKSPRVC